MARKVHTGCGERDQRQHISKTEKTRAVQDIAISRSVYYQASIDSEVSELSESNAISPSLL
jgi:hypothetical protein